MRKYVIGVDVGGTNVKVGIVGLGGKVYKKKVFSTKRFSSRNQLIDALVRDIKTVLSESRIRKSEVLGIGIGTPGLIDSEKGIIHYLVNIKGFRNVPLKRILERTLKIKTFLDNDVNVMALGELYYGRARGVKNAVCITLGTGVGGGIIIGGRLYRGTSLSAGEVGHMTINEGGPRCNCGNTGCLETYAGNSAIVKLAKIRMKRSKKTKLYKLVSGNTSKINPRVISEAALKGDALAKGVLEDTGKHIGVGLTTIINVLNPEKIIIGGGVADAGKILFDAIRKSVNKRAMKVPKQAVSIVKAKLGTEAGIIGAAALVKERLS